MNVLFVAEKRNIGEKIKKVLDENKDIFPDNYYIDYIHVVTHLNDDLASWIEDIEHKMSQPMPRRNYNLAFASGGSISNSFQVRSRNAMSFVEGSLTGIRSDRMYQTNQRNNTLGRYGEYR